MGRRMLQREARKSFVDLGRGVRAWMSARGTRRSVGWKLMASQRSAASAGAAPVSVSAATTLLDVEVEVEGRGVRYSRGLW